MDSDKRYPDDEKVRQFYKEHARNWVASDEPLDTPCKDRVSGCSCVSAGHPSHPFTSAYAFESVCRFLLNHDDHEQSS